MSLSQSSASRDGADVRFSAVWGQALSGYPALQCRCRSRARASLRNRHQGPSIMGFEDEVEQSLARPCRQCDGRFKRTYELTSSIVPRGTSFHRWVDLMNFASVALDRKKLAAFSPLGGGFLRFPIGDRRCNRTRASVGNAGGNARPSLTNATLAASRLLHRRSPTAPCSKVHWPPTEKSWPHFRAS